MSTSNKTPLTIQVNGETYERKAPLSNRILFRARNAGVHVGTIIKVTDHFIHIKNANRIYRWRGANTLSEIALHGVNRDSHTRIAETLPELVLTISDVCEQIPVSENVDLSPVWND